MLGVFAFPVEDEAAVGGGLGVVELVHDDVVEASGA
jgi:hypothetical protein